MSNTRPQQQVPGAVIAVLGGGYAGLFAAHRAARAITKARHSGAAVVLIDSDDAWQERTRWHQVAAGETVRSRSRARIFRGTRIATVTGTVTGIDLEDRKLTFGDRERHSSPPDPHRQGGQRTQGDGRALRHVRGHGRTHHPRRLPLGSWPQDTEQRCHSTTMRSVSAAASAEPSVPRFPASARGRRATTPSLSGSLVDRAALYGVLAMIETLGLELVELRRVTSPELVSRMVRAGELEVSGEDQAEVDTYFDQQKFRFHGPGGFETDYAGLTAYFASLRAAFDNRKITRGIIVAQGNTMACQTWIEGTFTHEFTQSPAGPLPPNGARIVIDLISIFRFDDNGRLIEEFVRTDYRSLLHQLGAEAH